METIKDSILWNEYEQLSKAFENNQSHAFQVPSVVIAAILGLTIFKEVNKDFFGFGLPIGIFFIFAWLGFCHSFINYYGLRLVEIEQRINTQLPKGSPDKLSFYTEYVGEAMSVVKGFKGYYSLIAILVIVGYIISLSNAWIVMGKWGWISSGKVVCVTTLTLITVIVLRNIVIVEKRTFKKKKKLLQKYGAIQGNNGKQSPTNN